MRSKPLPATPHDEASALRTRDLVALLAAVAAFLCAASAGGGSDAALVLTHYADFGAAEAAKDRAKGASALHGGGTNNGLDARVPSPLVTDLDGDGTGELVLLSGSPPTLKVLDLPAADGPGSASEVLSLAGQGAARPPIRRVKVTKEADLLHGLGVAAGKQPIALAAGYLEPYGGDGGGYAARGLPETFGGAGESARRQHVVVVREDWTVLCFNAHLDLQWEVHVGGDALDEVLRASGAKEAEEEDIWGRQELKGTGFNGVHELGGAQYELKDVAVLLTAQSAHAPGEEEEEERGGEHDGYHGGTVVVSGRVVRKAVGSGGFTTGSEADSSAEEGAAAGKKPPSSSEGEAEAEAEEGHFSFFALAGRDGSEVWSHTGRGVTAKKAAEHASGGGVSRQARPQHQYRLDPASVAGAHLSSLANHAGKGGGKEGAAKLNADDEGEDWTHFRSSVLTAALPHAWDSYEDTKLGLAHFVRQHAGGRAAAARHAHRRKDAGGGGGGGKRRQKGKSTGLGKHGDHGHPSVRMPGLSSATTRKHGGTKKHGKHGDHGGGGGGDGANMVAPLDASLPHLESEHLEKPNVVLAHSEHGVEAVTLVGGRPVFSLPLPRGGVYFDVNGDSVIDHLSVVEKRAGATPTTTTTTTTTPAGAAAALHSSGPSGAEHLHGLAAHGLHSLRQADAAPSVAQSRGHARLPPCSVLALSGIPAREQLFNGSLCSGHGAFSLADLDYGSSSSSRHYDRGSKRKGPSEVRASVPSALLVPHGGAFLGQLLAAQALADGRVPTFDAVLAVSTGVVSSYASDGYLNWQQREAPRWGDGADGFVVKVPMSLHFSTGSSSSSSSSSSPDFSSSSDGGSGGGPSPKNRRAAAAAMAAAAAAAEGGAVDEMIVAGETDMVVLSTATGRLLAEATLPEVSEWVSELS
jgi:hypothetical protein